MGNVKWSVSTSLWPEIFSTIIVMSGNNKLPDRKDGQERNMRGYFTGESSLRCKKYRKSD